MGNCAPRRLSRLKKAEKTVNYLRGPCSPALLASPNTNQGAILIGRSTALAGKGSGNRWVSPLSDCVRPEISQGMRTQPRSPSGDLTYSSELSDQPPVRSQSLQMTNGHSGTKCYRLSIPQIQGLGLKELRTSDSGERRLRIFYTGNELFWGWGLLNKNPNLHLLHIEIETEIEKQQYTYTYISYIT